MTSSPIVSSGVVELGVARAHIADLDTRIAALQDSIKELSLERSTWKSHLDAYLYPVLTLPNELVSEIFVRVREAAPKVSTLEAPLLLCGICRQWRDIALSTPELWDRLSMVPPQNIASHPDKLPTLETWLSLSGARPLFLGVRQGLRMSGAGHTIHRFLEVLLCHRSRWEALSLEIPFCDLHLLRADMPLLAALTLHVTNAPDNAFVGSEPLPVFDCAPKLESVFMHASLGQLLLLPWSQLKSLVLSATYPDEVFAILPLATNLLSLVVDIVAASDEIMPNIPPTLPPNLSLTGLHIHQTHPDAFIQFLGKLTLPSLTNLRIFSTPYIPPSVVTGLVARSACNMPALRIELDSWEYTEADYRALLPTVGRLS
ncbi:hypothetical protein C8R46DRAFT_1139495 [Mycena filopes]|nr:hypothetical protein C8R46DRAFT_1139495 [Mycena filopes]